MGYLNKNYRFSRDQYGLAIIEVTGRITADLAAEIEANVCRRYQMVPLPHMSGAILKSMDGTKPVLTDVQPSTWSKIYVCVKVEGTVNPLSYVQTGGIANGKAVLSFLIRYQEVGGVS